jgi:hypothetical protein
VRAHQSLGFLSSFLSEEQLGRPNSGHSFLPSLSLMYTFLLSANKGEGEETDAEETWMDISILACHSQTKSFLFPIIKRVEGVAGVEERA